MSAKSHFEHFVGRRYNEEALRSDKHLELRREDEEEEEDEEEGGKGPLSNLYKREQCHRALFFFLFYPAFNTFS